MIVYAMCAFKGEECNDCLDSALLICICMIMVRMLKERDSRVAAAYGVIYVLLRIIYSILPH